ncbi:MAG: maleylpyruvate isomerase N-terminal domain-containing protein [Actinomycetota bacterium]
MNTEELLQREDQAWLAFVDAFAAVPDDQRDREGVVPGWSTQDLVWHCGYWAGYVGDALERIARGETLEDQDWDDVNDKVIEDGRGMSWDEIIVRSEHNRERARTGLRALPTLTDAAVEEFTGETFEHYEEHAAELRAFTTG